MLILFSLAVLLHVFLLTNTRPTIWPEMVVYPYLINKGFLLYKDILNPYQPALSYFLTFFSKIFGYGVPVFHTLTILTILIIDVSIFFVSNQLFKSKSAAFLSIIFFIVFSIPFQVNGLWFDLVQTPFILFSLFFFHKFLNNQKEKDFFLTVLLLTIAFFIKQQILWTIIWYSIYFFIVNGRKCPLVLKRNILAFLFPALTFIIFFLFFFLKGVLSDYLFWAFTFPFFKASALPGYVAFPSKRQIFVILLLTAAAIPYFSKRKSALFFGTYLSALPFAYPRFDYFHLIPALSVVSLVFWPSLLLSFKRKSFFIIVSVSLLILFLFSLRSYRINWGKETRFFEANIYQLSADIKEIAKINSSLIFIQNGPEQLYPLADIIPSKPWGTQFPWYMELGDTQNRIIEGLQNEQVKLILTRSYDQGGKYDLGAYKPEILSTYIEKNYSPYWQLSKDLILKKKNEDQ